MFEREPLDIQELPTYSKGIVMMLQRNAMLGVCIVVLLHMGHAQTGAPIGAPVVSETSTPASAFPRVCCRPLYRFNHARLAPVRLLGVPTRIFDHCYIETQPGVTIGIHPIAPHAANKQPIPNQDTDNTTYGGECKKIEDATPEKLERLQKQIDARTCNSCGRDYHNTVGTGCFNNSNTYVYDMVKSAGMKPPSFDRAPGYRLHHRCR